MLKSWDLLVAPRPDPLPRGSWRFTVSFCSPWISVNVLSLDERRVVVEKNQVSLQRALRDWGFEPIPCPFLSYAVFGGAFHCATLDVRRRGELRSYF
jgi:glycine amidinotransferase